MAIVGIQKMGTFTSSKRYMASYYDAKTEKNYAAKVKIFPSKYIDNVLDLMLVGTESGKILESHKSKKKKTIVSDSIEKDLNTISKMLENIDLKNDTIRIMHAIKDKETLEDIAQKYGTTERSIKQLNTFIEARKDLKAGNVLTIEQKVKLSNAQREIKMLEVYFEYLLKESSIAKLITQGKSVNPSLQKYYELLFGKSARNYSIEKKVELASKTYRDKKGHIKNEKELEYISALYNIADEAEEKLNLSGKVQMVVSIQEFKKLCAF